MKKEIILITGGAGFIGSNFVLKLLPSNPNIHFVIIDSLTYASNYSNIEKCIQYNSNTDFFKIDIRDKNSLESIFKKYSFTGIINIAAESHVDQSIADPSIFASTNIIGTLNLLNLSLHEYKLNPNFKFLQVSTDEVYGQLALNDKPFTRSSPISPRSPYSASKASADHLVLSFHHTYGLNCIITRCCNNFGPYQHEEKLIPLMIQKALKNLPLPVYGKGENIREWIHVNDHINGILLAYQKGTSGSIYHFGSGIEMSNIEIVKKIIKITNCSQNLITYVQDRPGHDFRYSLDFDDSIKELNFRPERTNFDKELNDLVRWTMSHQVLEKTRNEIHV